MKGDSVPRSSWSAFFLVIGLLFVMAAGFANGPNTISWPLLIGGLVIAGAALAYMVTHRRY